MLSFGLLLLSLFAVSSEGGIVGQYQTQDGTATLSVCTQNRYIYVGLEDNGLVNGFGVASRRDKSSRKVYQVDSGFFHLNTYSLDVGFKLDFNGRGVSLTVPDAGLNYMFKKRISRDKDLTACLVPTSVYGDVIYGTSFVRYNDDGSINDVESFPNDFLPSMCYACCEGDDGDFYNGQVNGLQSFNNNRAVFGQYDTSSGVNTGNQMFVLTDEGLVTSFIEPGFSLTIDIGIPVDTEPQCPVPL